MSNPTSRFQSAEMQIRAMNIRVRFFSIPFDPFESVSLETYSNFFAQVRDSIAAILRKRINQVSGKNVCVRAMFSSLLLRFPRLSVPENGRYGRRE